MCAILCNRWNVVELLGRWKMKKLSGQPKTISIISLTCAFISSFIVFSYTPSCADFASAHEDRIKQQQSDDRYWRNQDRIYNTLDKLEEESALEYRKERRKLDLEKRKDKSKSKTKKNKKRYKYNRSINH